VLSILALAATIDLAVPFVPQDKDTCGAAALAMVLGYWGQPVPHSEIASAVAEPELADAPAPLLPARRLQWRTLRYLGPALATAAAVLVMIGVTLRTAPTGASWEVASLAGQPRQNKRAQSISSRLKVTKT